jgi:hypothetical protein
VGKTLRDLMIVMNNLTEKMKWTGKQMEWRRGAIL